MSAAWETGKRVIAIDPGYQDRLQGGGSGETGKLLAYTTIYPTEPKRDVAGTERVLTRIIDKYGIDVIVIGNGTASRETEEVVANFLKKNLISDSVYDRKRSRRVGLFRFQAGRRGVSGSGRRPPREPCRWERRLQDPLAELVKIDPKTA